MARRTGWGGELPVDDTEAVARILCAARLVIESEGADVSVTLVARELRVTRQTVYRYFRSVQELLAAVALDAGRTAAPTIIDRVRTITDPAAVVVELVASAIEILTTDRVLVFLLGPGASTGLLGGSMTGQVARDQARSILDELEFDWHKLGFDDDTFDQLVEWCLLVIGAYIHRPDDEIPEPSQLRTYLSVWMRPSIEAARGGNRGARRRPAAGTMTQSVP
ncbi:TetR family transcriptional regulator [Gordonia sp. SID5947]|uniref:TetR/AcrR family transcriptional regulator n=1 Tax=Gordonia sp. SID5947 TaxID=2690315 RepID=UPI0013714D73|nr:TetR/AcrR family transcriptional regulator [Gordonia sp. SID5947]MYR07169.1 TetR family transcriptional regulator [Gordonia sp. SID5947]